MAKKGPGRGRLPALKNLLKKTPEQLLKTLDRFNIDPDMSGLVARSKKQWTNIERMLLEGTVPDAATWEKIHKQTEREMTNNLRKMVKSSIREYRLGQLGESGKFMWLTSGKNVCPSCEPRHGKVKTMRQWKALGLPGSQGLVCSDECKCQLLPAP